MVDHKHSQSSTPVAQSELAKTLGTRLAARRKAMQLTQVDLSELVGVDMETISRFERGKHLPSLMTLKLLATHLGSSVGALLGEDEVAETKSLAQLTPALALLSEEDRDYALQAMHGLCVHLGKRTR